jgi:hypothetical protein
MSKGKTKSTSTSNTSQTLNPWSQNQFQTQFGKVQNSLDANPVQAYSGSLVAGLSGREQAARSGFEGNMGSFNPVFDRVEADFNNAGLQADFGGVADQYMNPYESQVIDSTMSDITRMNEGQNAAMRGRAAASGAYGGSGVAVGQALNNEAAQREMARTGSQLRYQGYNDARGYYGQDIDARERRAMGTANLAAQRHGMMTDDFMTQNEFGEVDRGIEQDRLGADYNEFLRQNEEKLRRTGIQAGLLGSIPMLTNTSGTSTNTQTTNPGLLGTLGQLGSMASLFVPGGQMMGMMSGGMKAMQKRGG